MYVTRFLSAAAAVALLSGVAIAQTAAPAQPPAAPPP
ncbi:peptidase M4, partial [Caulobacter sp. D4A]